MRLHAGNRKQQAENAGFNFLLVGVVFKVRQEGVKNKKANGCNTKIEHIYLCQIRPNATTNRQNCYYHELNAIREDQVKFLAAQEVGWITPGSGTLPRRRVDAPGTRRHTGKRQARER